MRSASVDFPWSIWAMIAKLRMLLAGPLTSEDPRRTPSSTRDTSRESGSSVPPIERDHARVSGPLLRRLSESGPAPTDLGLPHLHGHTDRDRGRDRGC